MNRSLRGVMVVGLVSLMTLAGATGASADHAGEAITLSQADGLVDGDSVTVTIANFDPAGKPAKVVIAGQGTLVTIPDKLNFDEYAVAPEITIAADGTGSTEIIVTSDHGVVQDGTTLNCLTQQCWIVAVQEPFLPQPNYASQAITFEGGSVPTTTEAVAAEETTTTAADATTTTTEATTTTTTPEDDEDSEDDGGGSGATFAIVAAIAAIAAGIGYFATRRKAPEE